MSGNIVSCNSHIFEEFIVAKRWEVRPSVLVIIMCKRHQQLKKEEVDFAEQTNTLLKDYPPINVFHSFHVSPHHYVHPTSLINISFVGAYHTKQLPSHQFASFTRII